MTIEAFEWDVTDRLKDEDSIRSFMENAIAGSNEDPVIIKTVLLVADRARKRWGIKPSIESRFLESQFKKKIERKKS